MILGLDLSASEKRRTGFYMKNIFGIFYKDEEILKFVEKYRPKIISIDSPLTYEIPFRKSERELIKLGFRPLPLSFQSMKKLYLRAINLVKNIKEIDKNIIVIETFPRAVEKIFGYNFNMFKNYFKYKDIYDAWLCYLSGLFFTLNKYKDIYGIILPDEKYIFRHNFRK